MRSSLARGPPLECAAVGHPLQAAPSRGAATTWSWASAAVGFTATCFLESDNCRKGGERVLNLSQGNNKKEKKKATGRKVSIGMIVTCQSAKSERAGMQITSIRPAPVPLLHLAGTWPRFTQEQEAELGFKPELFLLCTYYSPRPPSGLTTCLTQVR